MWQFVIGILFEAASVPCFIKATADTSSSSHWFLAGAILVGLGLCVWFIDALEVVADVVGGIID